MLSVSDAVEGNDQAAHGYPPPISQGYPSQGGYPPPPVPPPQSHGYPQPQSYQQQGYNQGYPGSQSSGPDQYDDAGEVCGCD